MLSGQQYSDVRLHKDTTQKDSYKLTVLMIRDTNILMKIATNWNKILFKKFIITNEVYPNSKSLIQRWKIISYVIHYTNRLKKKNYNTMQYNTIEAKKDSTWQN